MYPIQSKGRTLQLASPVVMGILNATPDSFFNKGRDSDTDGLLRTAEEMLNAGAALLDVGGASTRPGQPLIDSEEEKKRVVAPVAAIKRAFPDCWLSIDTYNSETAKAAVDAGADIVNDVSAGYIDEKMIATVAALRVPYIVMHMQGTPATMQQSPSYDNVVAEVKRHLAAVADKCELAGIADVIIDPGFGFGKTVEQNYELLGMLGTFHMLGRPILAGLSRKSMICRPLGISPAEALNGTSVLNLAALQQGAHILRVHDVKEAMETIKLWELLS